MKPIKVLLLVLPFLFSSAAAVQYFDISQPSIQKARLYVTIGSTSALNRRFVDQLKKMLSASLLFEISSSGPEADYAVRLERTIESGELLIGITGQRQSAYPAKTFGIRFQKSDSDYLSRRTAQMANRIIQEFFGIEGSIGSSLAWSVTDAARKTIWVRSFAVENAQKQVTYNFFSNYGISWGPAKDHIIYLSHTEHGTAVQLQQVDPLVLQATTLFKESGIASSPFWAPDGTVYMTLHVSAQNSDIYQFGLEEKPGQQDPMTLTRLRQVTRLPGIETESVVSPDSSQIAYVSDQTGEPQIYVMDLIAGSLNAQKSTRVSKIGNYNASPAWSPNGKYLAYRSIRDNTSVICRLELATGQEKILTTKPMSAEDPVWSPDGSLIAFAGKTGSNVPTKIYYILASGGQYQRVSNAGYEVEESSPSWGPALY
jgi:TolB protein